MTSFHLIAEGALKEELARRLADAGFSEVEAPDAADVIAVYKSSLTALEDSFFDEGGIFEGLMKDTVVVNMSPSTPNLASEVHSIATVSQIDYMEAPMCVRNMMAEEAFSHSNLTTFVGGDEDVVAKVRDFLDVIFSDVQHVGSVAAAQMARATNTLQKAAEMLSAVEAVTLYDAVKHSLTRMEFKDFSISATSPVAYFVLEAIKKDNLKSDYTVEMMMGEVNAVLMSSDDYDEILPQADTAYSLLELLAVLGGAQMSPAALYLVYGNIDKERCERHGLDWSKAQSMYEHGEDPTESAYDQFASDEEAGPFDDFYDDYSYEDELSRDISDFGYSSN